MANYVVTWEIDVEDAASPEVAAVAALAIQRDPSSQATVFQVQKVSRRWRLRDGFSRILGDPVDVYL